MESTYRSYSLFLVADEVSGSKCKSLVNQHVFAPEDGNFNNEGRMRKNGKG